mgnify:CR=1 FL=1
MYNVHDLQNTQIMNSNSESQDNLLNLPNQVKG